MSKTNDILKALQEQNPHEEEFLQAAQEVLATLDPLLKRHKELRDKKILERLLEPERVIQFRITWLNDKNEVQINRGFRVQMNSALGPYKGGLRFHPSVNLSVLKFLAFEQVFKNALTGLNLGAGKGGADFNPKGRSDTEIMRFCQAFMGELNRFIGPRLDVPAGDIGVGTREIGYLYGSYKKLQNSSAGGVLTGKGIEWGGSPLRTEATGYGLVYFAQRMLREKNESLRAKTCAISGAGNVAQYCAEKLIHLGAKPVAMSDSKGFFYDEKGITEEKLDFIKELKNEKQGSLKEYAEKFGVEYTAVDPGAEENPLWALDVDCAFPCATQNEVSGADAKVMVDNGVRLLAEGANMPLTSDALHTITSSRMLYGPGKASNAGGVAVSGIEMMQNYRGEQFSRSEVDRRLQQIMEEIHDECLETAAEYGQKRNYLAGANMAGFLRVAHAMRAQGVL